MFDAADWRSPQEPEEGGRIFEVFAKLQGKLELRFANRAVQFQRIRVGDVMWRTSDPELERVARPFTEAAGPLRKQDVRVAVHAHVGQPLKLVWSLVKRPGVVVTTTSPAALEKAQSRGVDAEYLKQQLGRLGNSPYQLAEVELDTDGESFAPGSLLNQLRREAVQALQVLQGGVATEEIHRVAIPNVGRAGAGAGAAQIHLLVRVPEQLSAALELRPASITLDYLDLYGLKPSVKLVQDAGIKARVAAPRILKPGEERVVDFLIRLEADILVRSSGLLERLRHDGAQNMTGDFSLNAANSVTAKLLLDAGVTRITPTHDLNAEQVATLAEQIGGEVLEAIVYQHLPVFHTEHCVFCRFLSSGTSYKDCGRPCEKHTVGLRDLNGRVHPLMADIGCRNTVFGAEAQEASAHLARWREAGIRHFRLEFAHESGVQVKRVVSAFEAAVSGGMSAGRLGEEWRKAAPQSTTQGSLFVPVERLELTALQ